MSAIKLFFSSNIGRKYLVGITGIGLSLFVLIHMLGNILIFVGPEAYNKYSHALVSNPALPIIEIGLLSIFLGHLIWALILTFKNWASRTQKYAVASNGEKKTTLIQKTLWAQGTLVLAFVILHLITFKYGPYYTVVYDGVTMRDLYKLVLEVFQSPIYVGWYVFAVALLLVHLSHGVGSSLQTMGFNHPSYNDFIQKLSWGYGVVVGVGFIAQPLYVFIFHQG